MATGTGNALRGLGGATGYGEIALPRSDDASVRQDWSSVFEDGLHYFGQHWAADAVYVNTNGTISFGAGLPGYPSAAALAAGLPDVIAPLWADVDTRLRGEGRESGAVYVDIDPIADCVSITWDAVGAYRRNTEQVNRFQVQLYDRGQGDFDIVLRYEAIKWVGGSSPDDLGARAFLGSHRLVSAVSWLPAGAGPQDLDRAPGNSGVVGLWQFDMRDGSLAGIAPARGRVLMGTAGGDHLAGSGSSDLLRGGGGADWLRGGAGNDTLFGAAGNDHLYGQEGDDFLFGGQGPGADHLSAGAGADQVFGGGGADLVLGGAGGDVLKGGFGRDSLKGQAGADLLRGSGGADQLWGGADADTLSGGTGADWLWGGAGADRFVLARATQGRDRIFDYQAAAGDVLVCGWQGASLDQFRLVRAPLAGVGRGDVADLTLRYLSSGQVLWTLVDAGAEHHLRLMLSGQMHDLPI